MDEVAPDLPPRCRNTRQLLGPLLTGTLPAWRRRGVEHHLRGCVECQVERDAQSAVMAGLDVVEVPTEDPPEGLLDSLLAAAEEPDLRSRVAVPMRGAVSGARPGLTVSMLLVALTAGALATWATWRAGRRLLDLLRPRH